MDIITNVLYWLTTGLLVPVIVLLLVLFVRALILGGAFYGAYINRQKQKKYLKNEMKNKSTSTFLDELSKKSTKEDNLSIFMIEIKKNKTSQATINKLIGDYEILADKDLGQSKSLTKLGPMLGLMGTLIPMGPALVGLSTGDISTMAHNMQVAFATTVIGIFIGAIGFITLQIKQRWYADDMNTLEYVADTLKEEKQ